MKRDLAPSIEATLRWPDGWPRTLIDQRESRSAWKKPVMEYQKAWLLHRKFERSRQSVRTRQP